MAAIAPSVSGLVGRAATWTELSPSDRRRRAFAACRDRDPAQLWSLCEAYLTLHGRAGALVSDHTRRSYRTAVTQLLALWPHENLAHPSADAPALLVRRLEAGGLSAGTIKVRLAGMRALYKALHWATNISLGDAEHDRRLPRIDADPFADVSPARDPTPAHEKRTPYSSAELRQLLDHADPTMAIVVLLGSSAGLRHSEMLDLRWEDLDLGRQTLTVVRGKNRTTRTVPLTPRLAAALHDFAQEPRLLARNAYIISTLGHPRTVRRHLVRLCTRAGVRYRTVHALRHSCGTRVYGKTGRLEDAQAMLGHKNIATTQIYAAWNDERLRAALVDL